MGLRPHPSPSFSLLSSLPCPISLLQSFPLAQNFRAGDILGLISLSPVRNLKLREEKGLVQSHKELK